MANGITALAIGDPHLRTKYIKVVDEFIKQTIEIVASAKPNFVVILGDTLHHHEKAQESCHTRAVNWFKELSKYSKVYVLIGNHDRPNNSHFLTDNHFFNGLKGYPNIEIVDKAHSMEVEIEKRRYRFVFIPYVPPGKFQAALDTLDTTIEDDRPKAIFAHQEFKGCKMGAIESEIGDEWGEKQPFVITGHIHEYQMIGSNIMYVGTPYQTTYAETDNKGVFLFTFGGENGDSAKRVRLRLRVKQKIVLQTNEVEAWKIPKTEDAEGDIDLRVDIVGKKEDIEAVKQLPIYKSMKETSWIRVVLQPSFEMPEYKTDLSRVSYMQVLHDTVKDDEEMVELYQELLRSIQ